MFVNGPLQLSVIKKFVCAFNSLRLSEHFAIATLFLRGLLGHNGRGAASRFFRRRDLVSHSHVKHVQHRATADGRAGHTSHESGRGHRGQTTAHAPKHTRRKDTDTRLIHRTERRGRQVERAASSQDARRIRSHAGRPGSGNGTASRVASCAPRPRHATADRSTAGTVHVHRVGTGDHRREIKDQGPLMKVFR